MDVLSGALTGSGVGTDVHGPYEAERLQPVRSPVPRARPRPRSATAPGTRPGSRGSSRRSRACPWRQGFDEVFYPGEVEDRAEAATLAAGGIVLAEQSLGDLRRLAAETGVPFPAGAGSVMAVLPPAGPGDASKADLVHRQLKEEIELGELAPGTPLSELSLVERTGASRTPSVKRCADWPPTVWST